MSKEKAMTKERLLSYISLRMEIENQLERLERLKNEAKIPAIRRGEGSHRNQYKNGKMERAIIRAMEYEEAIGPMIDANRLEMHAIENAIDSLPDPMEREILRLRYIDGDFCRHMPWKDVAFHLFGNNDDRHMLAVYRLHGRALMSISHLTLPSAACYRSV